MNLKEWKPKPTNQHGDVKKVKNTTIYKTKTNNETKILYSKKKDTLFMHPKQYFIEELRTKKNKKNAGNKVRKRIGNNQYKKPTKIDTPNSKHIYTLWQFG